MRQQFNDPTEVYETGRQFQEDKEKQEAFKKEIFGRLSNRLKALALSTIRNQKKADSVEITSGKQWAYQPGTNVITYPMEGKASVFQLSERECIGAILHEIGHVNFSSSLSNIVSVPEPADEFAQLLNSIEDLRIERRMYYNFPGTYDNFSMLADFCSQMISPETQREALKSHINALVNLHNKEWNLPETYKNEEVKTFVEQVWPDLRYKLTELKSSTALLDYIKDNIWPEYKKLIKDDQDQDKIDQGQDQEGEGNGGGQAPQDPNQGMDLNEIMQSLKNLEGNLNPDKDAQGDSEGEAEGDGENTGEDAQNGSQPRQGGAQRGSWVEQIAQEIKDEERQKAENAQRHQQAIAKADKDLTKKTGDPRHLTRIPYEKLLAEVQPQISVLTRRLKSILTDNRLDRHGGKFLDGKLNHGSLYQFRCNDPRLFTRKVMRRNKAYAFSLLIDMSGSMCGEPIHQAALSSILLAESLAKVDVDFEILGFNDRMFLFKGFGQKFDWSKRRNMELIIPSCGSVTNDAFALHVTNQRIQQFTKDTKKVIITLSDGSPNPTFGEVNHDDAEYLVSRRILQNKPTYRDFDLQYEIDEASEHAHVIGLGIMDRSVEKYYPSSEFIKRPGDIPHAVTKQVRKFIRRG